MLVAAAGIVIAVIGYQRISTSAVTGSLVGYRLVDDETASVTISVTRSDPSRPVACIVRVRATNGSETGRRELLVPPSEATTVQVTTTVKSSQPPVMADVYGCGTEVPSYLRLPDRGGSMDRCTVLPGPYCCINGRTQNGAAATRGETPNIPDSAAGRDPKLARLRGNDNTRSATR